MYSGSCLCGKVKYEIHGELGPVYFCHCGRCRKASGTAFLAGAQFDPDDFHLLAGIGVIREFESSPGVYRVFCGHCASPLYSRRPGPPETRRLRLGSLDTPLRAKPESHIFYGDKAEWFEMHDDVPTYAQRPP